MLVKSSTEFSLSLTKYYTRYSAYPFTWSTVLQIVEHRLDNMKVYAIMMAYLIIAK